jgi:hypothetical protein
LAITLLILINILVIISKLIFRDKSGIDKIPKYYQVIIKGVLCTIVVILAYYSGLESWSSLIIIWLGLFIGPELLIHDIAEKSILSLAKLLASKGLSVSIFAFLEYVTIPHILDLPDGPANLGGFDFQVTFGLKVILIFVSMIIIISVSNIFENIYEYVLNRKGISLIKGWIALVIILSILSLFIHPIYQGNIYQEKEVPIKPKDVLEKSSQILDLLADPLSPQVAYSSMNWTAVITNPDNSHILYRFFLNGKPETNWQHQNYWIWNITEKSIGKNKIEVRIKDERNANVDEFDDSKSTTCMIGR